MAVGTSRLATGDWLSLAQSSLQYRGMAKRQRRERNHSSTKCGALPGGMGGYLSFRYKVCAGEKIGWNFRPLSLTHLLFHTVPEMPEQSC